MTLSMLVKSLHIIAYQDSLRKDVEMQIVILLCCVYKDSSINTTVTIDKIWQYYLPEEKEVQAT